MIRRKATAASCKFPAVGDSLGRTGNGGVSAGVAMAVLLSHLELTSSPLDPCTALARRGRTTGRGSAAGEVLARGPEGDRAPQPGGDGCLAGGAVVRQGALATGGPERGGDRSRGGLVARCPGTGGFRGGKAAGSTGADALATTRPLLRALISVAGPPNMLRRIGGDDSLPWPPGKAPGVTRPLAEEPPWATGRSPCAGGGWPRRGAPSSRCGWLAPGTELAAPLLPGPQAAAPLGASAPPAEEARRCRAPAASRGPPRSAGLLALWAWPPSGGVGVAPLAAAKALCRGSNGTAGCRRWALAESPLTTATRLARKPALLGLLVLRLLGPALACPRLLVWLPSPSALPACRASAWATGSPCEASSAPWPSQGPAALATRRPATAAASKACVISYASSFAAPLLSQASTAKLLAACGSVLPHVSDATSARRCGSWSLRCKR